MLLSFGSLLHFKVKAVKAGEEPAACDARENQHDKWKIAGYRVAKVFIVILLVKEVE